MAARFQRITPFLWFTSAETLEGAVTLYTSVFEDSRILTRTHYTKESAQPGGQPVGALMTMAFQLAGQDFAAINGGPHFTFNESISFVVNCETQAELDRYWSRLSEGGDEKAQQCGWLKDRFGVSWQVVPVMLPQLLASTAPEKARRVMEVLLKMKKLDIAELQRAAG
ncbi:VOC family protein [Myxococcus sp. K15C18031901]|uniref:VOC family protein n=1 Tax=Myxococcus dinghuensis TaxID=2906761 RepID=UPI0020A765C5|nr:VOC family protein [Myxococcus dinghuensis]MCP3099637.1 VOC family protein [Myxococcus dinghuensis]